MSDLTTQQLKLGLSSHNNNYLFSNHYLDNILKDSDAWRPTWQQAVKHGRDLLTFLQPLYEQEREQLPDYSESQLEEHWFKPILTYLGHTYEGQAKIPALQERGVKFPDYVFFPDDPTRQAAVSAQKSDAYTNDALALGEVKRWDVSLDRKLKSGQVSFADNNPMYQIDYYLRATGLTWGILSNGRVWRLLHKESSYKLDIYFELDLEQALLQADTASGQAIAAFFVLFFQQASFRPDSKGRTFLNEALTASTRYAQELEEDLRDNAYRALEHLIQGFIEPSPNNLTAVDLPHIYTNSLYLLYRIIFLFYGERRGLLPMGNPGYAERSLTQLAQDIADQFDKGRNYPFTSRQLYARLSELFTIINGTDPDLNAYLGVPRYNGGLFNPQLHPFLVDYYVGDGHLAQAINVLARREVADGKTSYKWENVDYRTLGVRQIGSIYEGLLEYKPRRASRDLVAVKKGKTEAWVPVAEKPKSVRLSSSPTRQVGDIYLETDKGERKATGSYYTPDYIVKYIVEQTLTPLVTQARDRAEAQGVPLETELLQLNVLDPAMGSGHFLVEATNFLARKLIEAGSENEADPSRETELTYWKRRVVEACIYGVDKNPMAVELAKLSLWLETVAADKPLSFLDHHLRQGDSLVGARLADLRRTPGAREEAQAEGQKPLLDEGAFTKDVNLAVGGMNRIETMLSETLEDVHTKEGIFQELQGHLTKWQQLADLWVSYYFGNSFTPQEYRALSAYVQGQTSSMSEKEAAHWLAHPAVTDNDYFHWELAFPEVFFDKHGRGLGDSAGFGAVIGNPPYGFITDKHTQNILKLLSKSEGGNLDLFAVFVDKGLQITQVQGLLSYIAPTSLQTGIVYQSLRKFLLTASQITTIVNLPYDVFPDAYIDTAIYVLQKIKDLETYMSNQFTSKVYEFGKREDAQQVLTSGVMSYQEVVSSYWLEDNQQRFLTNIEALQIKQAIARCSTITLEEVTDSARGILVADKYIKPKPAGSLWKPFFDGDVYRYEMHTSSLKWVEYGDNLSESPRSYHYFIEDRILLRRLINRQFRLMATFTKSEFVNKKDLYNVIAVGEYSILTILVLLNSKLYSYLYITQSTVASRDDFPQVTLSGLRSLPLPKMSFTTPEAERTAALQTALTHYEKGDDTAVLSWAEAELTHPRNDTLHDLLAHLAQVMLDLNQQKQEKLSDFWLDLEGVTDATSYDTLRHKGKWQQSIHKSIPSARPFVDAASRSTATLDETLGWNEEAFKGMVKLLVKKVDNLSGLVRLYRKYQPTITTLNHQLSRTDTLIDQLVYRLYALTPAEIALIEGQTA